MRLSVELIDYIFGFLVSHPLTLNACSEDPVLSQIVGRHLYHSITVSFRTSDADYESPARLTRSISENPRILFYVRVLRIRVIKHKKYDNSDVDIKQGLNQFAKTLRMFRALECIKLTTSQKFNWPDVFRAALEDRLGLPGLKKLHIEGNQNCPCSFIDNHENIEDLLLSPALHLGTKRRRCVSTLPQLKSLTLLTWPYNCSTASITPHIKELRWLKCGSSAVGHLPEFLKVCSQTLNKLDIDLRCLKYYTDKQKLCYKHLPELSPVPPNLRQLSLYVAVYPDETEHVHLPKVGMSFLLAAAINTFASSVRHLIIELEIWPSHSFSNLDYFDFSPLAVLGPASQLIPRIDMYFQTDKFQPNDTLARLLSALAAYDDITRSIEDGILVIHPEKTAPKNEEDWSHLGPDNP